MHYSIVVTVALALANGIVAAPANDTISLMPRGDKNYHCEKGSYDDGPGCSSADALGCVAILHKKGDQFCGVDPTPARACDYNSCEVWLVGAASGKQQSWW